MLNWLSLSANLSNRAKNNLRPKVNGNVYFWYFWEFLSLFIILFFVCNFLYIFCMQKNHPFQKKLWIPFFLWRLEKVSKLWVSLKFAKFTKVAKCFELWIILEFTKVNIALLILWVDLRYLIKYVINITSWLKWGGLCPQIDMYGRKFNFQHCYGLKKIQFWKQIKSKGK